MDIAEFIGARLDDWEYFAKQGYGCATGSRYEGQPQAWVDWLHTGGSPEFGLALVKTLREVVDRYKDMHHHAPPIPESKFPEIRIEDTGACRTCITLMMLAGAWSGHPDYKAGWATPTKHPIR